MDVNILLFKCGKSNQAYGVRVQKMEDGDWWRTWAFKVKPRYAKNEGYDRNRVQGNLYCTQEYPGCPYCGTLSFIQCGNCHKMSCWNGETKMTCPWCESIMENIVEATDKFDIDGDKF